MRLDHLLSKESLSGPFGSDTPSRSLTIRCRLHPAPGGPHIVSDVSSVRPVGSGFDGGHHYSVLRERPSDPVHRTARGDTALRREADRAIDGPIGRSPVPIRTHSSVCSLMCGVRIARCAHLENSIASTSIYVLQVIKSQRRMPWRLKPKKDVGGCDKPRGAAYQARIRGCPNGETRHPSWGATLV